MRLKTFCKLIDESIMIMPLYIDGELILNPLNIGWEYTSSESIDYYQYEIEKITFNYDCEQIEPDIHLNPIKPTIDIVKREWVFLSDFISLLEPHIQYYLDPKYYKDDNRYRTEIIHNRLISKIEWDINEKCYYIL